MEASDPCPVCGGDARDTVLTVWDVRFGVPGDWTITRCRGCGLEATAPRPPPAELKAFYERYYNYVGGPSSGYASWRRRFLGSARLQRWWSEIDGDITFTNRSGSGRLLDFGCNEGRGLLRFRANGFAAEGLEFNPLAAERARALGFIVHLDAIEDFLPENPFDVVVLSNVIEHHPDPASCLRHCRRLLADGGEVWISCPNRRSWVRTLFGRGWINWHVPFHFHHFSSDDLRVLLGRCGFVVESSRCATPALWLAQSAIVRATSRRGQPSRWMRNPLLVGGLMLLFRGFGFPFLWLGNLLGRGDCLVVRARAIPPAKVA